MDSLCARDGAGRSAVHPGAMISDTLSLLAESTPIDTWFVARHRNDEHIVLHVTPRGTMPVAPGQVYASGDTPCGTVVRTQRPHLGVVDAASMSIPALGLMHESGASLYAGTPLLWAPEGESSECFGTLAGLGRASAAATIVRHGPLIAHAASVIGFALQAAHDADALRRRAERAESESTVDDLTRLYNRRGWHAIAYAEAGRVQRYGSAAGLVMIDLDELKRTNDAYGHRAGDALLRHAAQVIRASFRDSDVIARLGGDEFAVLVLESDAPATRWAAARVQESLSVQGIQASVGWSCLDGSRDIDAALHDADAAMYATKAAKRQFASGSGPDRPRCA